MDIKQRIEQRRLIVPELRKSLKILTLPSLDLKAVLDEEIINNPLLEEVQPEEPIAVDSPPPASSDTSLDRDEPDSDYKLNLITKMSSLHDILLRQLGMFANSNDELRIGQEIIGNIDDNGYLKEPLDIISSSLNETTQKVEQTLKLIQKLEPPGVGARSVSECLLIQLDLSKDDDPIVRKIIESHLEDVAKKDYGLISKAIKEPLENIEPAIKKILKLDPKPGRNYSSEQIHHIIPDAIIEQKGDEAQVIMDDQGIPILRINKTYEDMLKKDGIDNNTKEFLKEKLLSALELLRAINKRRTTLFNVIKTVVEIQKEAVKGGPSCLKPLTFSEVAKRIDMHETTVCRAVMNKFVRFPWGMISLKNLFPSHVNGKDGQSSVSSSHIKSLIKELVDREDKKHPLSDKNISQKIAEAKNLDLSRRTVTKYRKKLKILSSTFRRER
jgi:RNA polymerase sigma-54 factor